MAGALESKRRSILKIGFVTSTCVETRAQKPSSSCTSFDVVAPLFVR
jgi:hypothetical protein